MSKQHNHLTHSVELADRNLRNKLKASVKRVIIYNLIS